MNITEWTVLLVDGTEVDVTIPDIDYENDDHRGGAIAEAVRPQYDPDDVDDWWPRTTLRDLRDAFVDALARSIDEGAAHLGYGGEITTSIRDLVVTSEALVVALDAAKENTT